MRCLRGFGIAVHAYPTVACAEPDKELYLETNGSVENRTEYGLITALRRAEAHSVFSYYRYLRFFINNIPFFPIFKLLQNKDL